MNGHLKRVLILLLIFTFVFQMAGVTSLSRVQAYADTETAETVDAPEADEAEDMTTEEIDTESPGEIETDGENPPDAAEEPADPETVPEETAEVPEETAANETVTVEEPTPIKAPALKAATKAEKLGTVLAFTSDTHNKSGNTAANRLGTWIEKVKSLHGDIDVMAFGGDMAGAGAAGYWDLTQADMDILVENDVPGVYTTGNHEISYGGDFSYTTYQNNGYSATETKGQFEIDKEVASGDDYRIYCLGSRGSSESNPGYSNDQISDLDEYLMGAGNDKVIFIITHFPLHYFSSGMSSRTTTGASNLIDALNDAVTNNGQTIVFLWGHNHTLSDTYYDQIYGPGGVDTIEYTKGSSKTIKFYYGGAGCMSDNENGTGSKFVQGKGLVATINPNGGSSNLEFHYYNADGEDVTESNSIKSVNVEVTDPIPATGVTINEVTTGDDGQPVGKSIAAGKTLQLHLTLEPAGASSSGITWSTSDESVATVSDRGLVTAKKEGTATITAAVPSGTRAAAPTSSIEITVTAAPKVVNITPDSSNSPTENATIDVGETLTINVTNGSSSSAYDFTATLSNNSIAQIEGNATVNISAGAAGQFTVKGLTGGSVDITIQNSNSYGSQYARKGTIHLTVNGGGGDDPTPTGKTVDVTPNSTTTDEESITIDVDETFTINVTNGSTNSAYNFTATLSKEGVAEIQGNSTINIEKSSTGQFAVKGIAEGTVDITIQNNQSSSQYTRKAVVHLTVGDGGDTPADTVDYVLTDTMEAGGKYLIATGNNGNAFILSNESGAVNNSLKGYAVDVVNNKISITKTVEAKTLFEASGDDNNSIRLKLDNQYLYADGNGALRMVNSISDAGKFWHYKAEDNGTEKRLLWFYNGTTGDYGYTATGSYKYYLNVDSNGNFTKGYADNDTAINTVDTPKIYLYKEIEEVIPATDLTVSPTEKTILAGENAQLTATITPENATGTVTWTSNAETIATVDSSGKVTGVSVGTATITAAIDGLTATCTVTVNPVPVESVTLNKTTAEVMESKTLQLTATVLPETATDKTVTWSSSNPAIASVDNTGKVTGNAVGGPVTITATAGGKSATCAVTVTEYVAPTGYVIMVGGYALSHESADPDYFQVANTTNKYYGLKAVEYDPDDGPDENILWIITPAGESGYYITDQEGNYLNATYSSSTSGGSTIYTGQLKLDNTSDIWILEEGIDLDNWILSSSTLQSTNATNSDAAVSENKKIYLANGTGSVNSTNLITIRSGSSAADTSLIDPEHPVETYYVLSNTLTAGEKYLIVNTNEVGDGIALGHSDSTIAKDSIKINTGKAETDNKVYIDGEDVDGTSIWTAASGITLNNGTYYMRRSSSNTLKIDATNSNRNWTWSESNNRLSNSNYYLIYSGDAFSLSRTANSVYLYKETKVISGDTPHTHTYGEPEWTWVEDHTSATATFTCTECDDTQTVTDSAPVETVVTAASCEKNKVVKYTATVIFNGEEYTDSTENITIPDSALGHDFGEWTVTTPATCTEAGVETRTCSRCDATETRSVEATDHNWGQPTWAWYGFTAATATFTCANDSAHVETVDAAITSATEGVVTTYKATVTFNEQTYTNQKVDDSKLIKEASATFMLPIAGDNVTTKYPASVPEDVNYTAKVNGYKDANGNSLTSGTFEADKTYYVEYMFTAKDGYGFKGGAKNTSGQVPALADRVALTANGENVTEYINDAYTYGIVTALVPFTPENPEFNLTLNIFKPNGADGTATLSKTKAHRGDEITVTATPAPGSRFMYAEYKEAGVEVVKTPIGEDGKFIMPPYDTEVIVNFERVNYTITVTPNNESYGTASANQVSGNMGDEVTLTATPNEGYEFKEWKVLSGGVTIANNKFTVGTANVEIQAVFAPKDYTLTFFANEGDTEAYATVTKAYGTAITEADLPAAPAKAFYTFTEWASVPETMPANDVNIFASWTAKDAYYLIGSMTDWEVVEANEFAANPDNPGEYSVAATLTADDEIKVVKAVAGEAVNTEYYPSPDHKGYNDMTDNYTVDQYHAGNVTVYFRPAGNFDDQGWQEFGGFFYIEGDHAITVQTSPANAGTAQVIRSGGTEAATSAPKNMALTVNTVPADNYQLDRIEIWRTNGGTAAEQTLEGNTFNMPDYDVTVKVYFKAITWTFVGFTWEQTADGYNAIANYRGDNGSTKTVAATVTSRITTAATCEGGGQIVYTATVTAADSPDGTAQSEDKPVTIPAAGHEYGDLIPEVAPDCTTEGTKAHYECSVCHKLFDTNKVETTAEALKITATGHDWEFVNFTWTGSNEAGYTAAAANYRCKNDSEHTKAIDLTVSSETTTATCETAGSTVYTATIAEADSPDGIAHTDTRTVVLPELEHDWEFVGFTWSGNDEDGYTAAVANYKCKNDEEHVQTVDATVTSVTTEHTCEAAGSTVYTAAVTATDSLDKTEHSDNKTVTIPATGHKWIKPAAWTWTGDDENGYTKVGGTFTCENDPEHVQLVETTDITAVKVDPTPTTAGSITYTAELTGPNSVVYEIQKEVKLPPAGYTFKDPVYTWTKTADGYSVEALKACNEDHAQDITETVTASYAVTTAATCVTDGVGTYTASFTNSAFAAQTKTENISATGHTEVVDEAVAPTCTETGLTEGSHCSVCGTVLTAQTTVPALGHDWNDPTYEWNADHTSVIATFVCKNDAKHTDTATASGSAITSEITTQPTATTPGVRTYTASITFGGKTYTATATETIPATGASVSGNITSFVSNSAEGAVSVELFRDGSETAAYTATVSSDNKSYAFAGVDDGTYTMKVSKKDHATRTYEITVAGAAVTQDVKIHLLGDINGDGDVTTVDAARVNSHAKGKTLLTGYEFSCGDINGDGDITTVDAARTNAHAKGKSLIWE